MPGTDLKRKGGEGDRGGTAFPPLGDADPRPQPPAPGLHPRRWLTALVLSLVIHGAWLFLLWASSGAGTGETGHRIVDTRVAAGGPEVDFLISFPDEVPPPPPKTLPSSVTAVPVVREPEPTAPRTAPPLTTAPDDWPDSRGSHGQAVPQAGQVANGSHEPEGGTAGAFFRIPIRGQRLVFVIDRSASMGLSGAFAAARRELLACLDCLPAEARFQVIAYNRGAETLRVQGQSGLLTASADHKRQARRLLAALRAEGGTDHLAALKRALLLRPDAIYFLTDADDLTAAQIREVTRFNQGRTMIHTVELAGAPRGQAPSPLQVLAAYNRGVYRSVDLAQDGAD